MPQDTLNRFIRSLIQVIAAGGATAIFEAVTNLADDKYRAIVAGVFYLVIVLAQNLAEDFGIIPKILKPDPLQVEVVMEPQDPSRVI
jgi:hypothetical protein